MEISWLQAILIGILPACQVCRVWAVHRSVTIHSEDHWSEVSYAVSSSAM